MFLFVELMIVIALYIAPAGCMDLVKLLSIYWNQLSQLDRKSLVGLSSNLRQSCNEFEPLLAITGTFSKGRTESSLSKWLETFCAKHKRMLSKIDKLATGSVALLA